MTLADEFCAGLAAARRMPTEFPAFLMQPFTAETAAVLTAHLPPLSRYRPMAHPDAVLGGAPTRYAMPLVGEAEDGLAAALKSNQVRSAIAGLVRIDPALLAHPSVALLRDLPGYKIRIHPDSRHKIATVQIYLPSHHNSPHIGVRFYRDDGVGQFTEIAAVPYLPGSGYLFRRTENSWHGVNPTTEADGVRDSLMLIYFDNSESGF